MTMNVDLTNPPYYRFPITQARDVEPIDTKDIESFLNWNDHLEKKELAVFAIKHCARRTLPYGIWYCKDGREVLFNREYQPIAQRKNGVTAFADRSEWVMDIERAVMLWDDSSDPTNYLVKHLGYMALTTKESNVCRKALLVSLKFLKEFTPATSPSENNSWSLAK
jgi:hypothetical protein